MYSVVLIPAIEQSDSTIQMHAIFFIFFSMMVCRGILNIVPCAIQ